MQTIFPDPKLLGYEHIRIRVKVMSFQEIKWDFQSTLAGFEDYPSIPIDDFMILCNEKELERSSSKSPIPSNTKNNILKRLG